MEQLIDLEGAHIFMLASYDRPTKRKVTVLKTLVG